MTMQQPNCFAAGDIAGSTTAWLCPELVGEILSSPRRGYEWSSLSTSPLGFISHWTLTEGAVYVTGISGDFMWSPLQPIKASWISGWIFVDHGKRLSELAFWDPPVCQHVLALKLTEGVVERMERATFTDNHDPSPSRQRREFFMRLRSEWGLAEATRPVWSMGSAPERASTGCNGGGAGGGSSGKAPAL